MAEAPGRESHWLRAAGLFLATMSLAVGTPLVLVALPLAILVLVAPGQRLTALLVAGTALLLTMAGGGGSGMWYMERGWAILVGGCFAVLTLRWPQKDFVPRALAALAVAFAAAGLILLVRPGEWAVVDWVVHTRFVRAASTALEALQVVRGSAVPAAMAGMVHRAADFQGVVFPALLGLSSLSGLGVAWWLYVRLVHGSGEGLRGLREFRFNDQLVWVFIAGVVLVLLHAGGGLERAGANALVFMGALYVLRGVAVLVFVGGSVSLFGWLAILLAIVFLAPVVVAATLVVGLGDTWIDVRERARALTG